MILIKDKYNSDLEEYVVELLYRIEKGRSYLSACMAIMSARNSKHVSSLCIANDFFVVAFEALNIALMIEVAKLCDEDVKSCTVPRFFNKCESDKLFSAAIKDKKEFRKIIANFNCFWCQPKIKQIVKDIKTRRDKYYAHYDKEYFRKTNELAKETAVDYDNIELLLNCFREWCTAIYKQATAKDWVPNLHQGCVSPQRDCKDLIKLLERIRIE